MNLAWVISQLYEPEQSQDVFGFKDVAPIWGSWSTWRTFQTDNVICHERARCQELLRRNLQQQCNFFLPQQHFADLGRPTGVQLYDGDFKQDTLALEDVIACHLAAATVDIVLLLGFDLSKPEPMEDRLAAHRLRNRLGLLRQLMASNDHVQWVLVDHPGKPDKAFRDLGNVMQDRLENVMALIGQTS